MDSVPSDILNRVFSRLRQVQRELGMTPLPPDDAEALLADQINSMGLVELLAVLAEENGIRPEEIEHAAGQRFSTVASLADALSKAIRAGSVSDGLLPVAHASGSDISERTSSPSCWLSAVKAYLPRTVENGADLDRRLQRPSGWLEAHAGIKRRHVWAGEDALDKAAELGRSSLQEAGLLSAQVGTLLVTSQAPPRLVGLAAALHQRLGLPARSVALEVGGACTGFLQCLWLARRLVEAGPVLVIAVEAPSQHLAVEPGEAGEAAALFGDAAGCCLVSGGSLGESSLPLVHVELSLAADEELLRVEGSGRDGPRVRMDGPRLASRAVEASAEMIRQIAERHNQPLLKLQGTIIHGGNGRLRPLVAKRLGLPEERIWSATAETGNLGSVSLQMAWARAEKIVGPLAWAAIGAGLSLASALTLAPVGN